MVVAEVVEWCEGAVGAGGAVASKAELLGGGAIGFTNLS